LLEFPCATSSAFCISKRSVVVDPNEVAVLRERSLPEEKFAKLAQNTWPVVAKMGAGSHQGIAPPSRIDKLPTNFAKNESGPVAAEALSSLRLESAGSVPQERQQA